LPPTRKLYHFPLRLFASKKVREPETASPALGTNALPDPCYPRHPWLLSKKLVMGNVRSGFDLIVVRLGQPICGRRIRQSRGRRGPMESTK